MVWKIIIIFNGTYQQNCSCHENSWLWYSEKVAWLPKDGFSRYKTQNPYLISPPPPAVVHFFLWLHPLPLLPFRGLDFRPLSGLWFSLEEGTPAPLSDSGLLLTSLALDIMLYKSQNDTAHFKFRRSQLQVQGKKETSIQSFWHQLLGVDDFF